VLHSCASAAPVPACTTGFVALSASRSADAAGLGFNHYTLSYSGTDVQTRFTRRSSAWSEREHAGHRDAVADVTLLPPGVTEFTVHLDMLVGGSTPDGQHDIPGQTQAIEITAAATVNLSRATTRSTLRRRS
jgi:hypothetical protein